MKITVMVTRRGVITLPAKLRQALGLKARKTAQTDIDLARRRFRALIQDRREQWPKC